MGETCIFVCSMIGASVFLFLYLNMGQHAMTNVELV